MKIIDALGRTSIALVYFGLYSRFYESLTFQQICVRAVLATVFSYLVDFAWRQYVRYGAWLNERAKKKATVQRSIRIVASSV